MTFANSTNPFDDLFLETHGGTMKEDGDEVVWDGDVDEVEYDSMDDEESL